MQLDQQQQPDVAVLIVHAYRFQLLHTCNMTEKLQKHYICFSLLKTTSTSQPLKQLKICVMLDFIDEPSNMLRKEISKLSLQEGEEPRLRISTWKVLPCSSLQRIPARSLLSQAYKEIQIVHINNLIRRSSKLSRKPKMILLTS